jgi:hypothetical protein
LNPGFGATTVQKAMECGKLVEKKVEKEGERYLDLGAR